MLTLTYFDSCSFGCLTVNTIVMHKIRLEGDHQTLTFGVVEVVDTMQPGGAKVNILP